MSVTWTVSEQGNTVAQIGKREMTILRLESGFVTVWCKTDQMNTMVHRSLTVEAAKAWCESH